MDNETTKDEKIKAILEKMATGGQPTIADLYDLTDEDMSRLAMLKNLEIMFSPMGQDLTLRASRQVLEWTRAKPAATVNATVSQGWIESLGEVPLMIDGKVIGSADDED